MTVSIRDATESDLPVLTAIYADAVDHGTATYELEAPTLDEMRARFANLRASEYPYLVAEEAGQVIGYAYAGPFRARPAYRFIVEDSIYIDPRAKGKGIGKLLMSALIEACRAGGYRQLVAVIGDGHADSPSVRLHDRMGFRHCGVLEGSGYKHGRWLDTVFMQLEMNGGNRAEPDPQSVPERLYHASCGRA
ncbi:MAG: N-acetyltransferase family protein [Rhizobiaceae bacterium]|nr:N-acetyltransferase family protein [Rhizobiaceae bacterium]